MSYEIKVLKITATDLDEDNFYIGSENVADFDGTIEIAALLGCVKFKGHLKAKFSIIAYPGSGIEAGEGIEAGWGIKAGWSIEAGLGIKAGWGIEAGSGIKAGLGIEAGSGIEAGDGIEAGLSIVAKWVSSRLRIFAGLVLWRLPTDAELEIRAELRSGTIAYGVHVAPVTTTKKG